MRISTHVKRLSLFCLLSHRHLNLFTCRNPGVDPGKEGRHVDELSHPLCPRKCKQVQYSSFDILKGHCGVFGLLCRYEMFVRAGQE